MRLFKRTIEVDVNDMASEKLTAEDEARIEGLMVEAMSRCCDELIKLVGADGIHVYVY